MRAIPGDPQRAWQRRPNSVFINPLHLDPESTVRNFQRRKAIDLAIGPSWDKFATKLTLDCLSSALVPKHGFGKVVYHLRESHSLGTCSASALMRQNWRVEEGRISGAPKYFKVLFDDNTLGPSIDRRTQIEMVPGHDHDVEIARHIEDPVELRQRVMQVGYQKQSHDRPRIRIAGSKATV
jgi:hypothetical protein